MFDKVSFSEVNAILDPSAGKGDLLMALGSYKYGGVSAYRYRDEPEYSVHAIEIEPELRAILKDNKISVIDNDFLTHGGSMHYDLIVANFPFSDGDKHLHKCNGLQL